MGNRQINPLCFSFGTPHEEVARYMYVLEIEQLHSSCLPSVEKQIKDIPNEIIQKFVNDIIIALHYIIRMDGEGVVKNTKCYCFSTSQTKLLKIVVKNAEPLPPPTKGIRDNYYYRMCALHMLLSPTPNKIK